MTLMKGRNGNQYCHWNPPSVLNSHYLALPNIKTVEIWISRRALEGTFVHSLISRYLLHLFFHWYSINFSLSRIRIYWNGIFLITDCWRNKWEFTNINGYTTLIGWLRIVKWTQMEISSCSYEVCSWVMFKKICGWKKEWSF